MMPEKRRYLRVMRIKPYHFFLLTRIDPADGQRLRAQEVVAACAHCRCVSRRQNWLANNSCCPLCGSEDSFALRDMHTLRSIGAEHALHSRRHPPALRCIMQFVLPCLLVIVLLFLFIRTPKHQSGFFRAEDGRFYYLNNEGSRYSEGSYHINNITYRFSDGYVMGPCQLSSNDLIYVIDENGYTSAGWKVMNGAYLHTNEQGLIDGRYLDLENDGFYSIEGLGNVFVTEGEIAPSGWILHQGGLYHLQDGAPAPLEGYLGTFDENGRYLPDTDCFVQLDNKKAFLHADGTLGKNLVVYHGAVYQLDEQGVLLLPTTPDASFSVEKNNSATLSPDGMLIPESDVKLLCDRGYVVIAGQTGHIRTGWFIYRQHVYCTDAQGYLLTDCKSTDPAGFFNTEGHFVPASAGVINIDNLHCCLTEDGTLLTGYVKQGDRLYLYDENGHLMPNITNGRIGMTDSTGAFRPFTPGMYQLGDSYFCLGEDGLLMTGWQNCGKLYFFDPQTGRRAENSVLTDGRAYALNADGAFVPGHEGAYSMGENTYYLSAEGDVLTGWHVVEGKPVRFDPATGAMTASVTQNIDPGWFDQNKDRFYILSDGTAAQGWQIIDQHVYYFLPVSCKMVTGSAQIDGMTYTFRDDGRLTPAQATVIIIDGAPMRIGENGKPQGGIVYTDGHLFLYDAQTARLTKQADADIPGYISTLGGYIIPNTPGLFTAYENTYYLETSGTVLTGWFLREGKLYFADPQTGLVPRDGYSKTWQGVFNAGSFTPEKDGLFVTDGRSYHFSNGEIISGWVANEGSVSYIDPATGLFLKNTERTIDGVLCSFDENGRYCPTDAAIVTLTNGRRIAVLEEGDVPAAPGVIFSNNRLYAHNNAGYIAANTTEAGLDTADVTLSDGVVIPRTAGLVQLHGEKYLLDSSGTCTTGIVVHNNYLYNFSSVTGKMIRNVNHYDEDGIYRPTEMGLIFFNGNAYWVEDPSGRIATGLIVDDDGFYYATQDGCLASDVTSINGNLYYFDPKDNYRMVQNNFIFATDDRIYYAKENGILAVGWVTVNDSLHYFNDDGTMLYNTIKDGKYINMYGEVK